MSLIIKHLGVPVVSITSGKLADLEKHLAAYPEIRDEYIAGNVTAEESAEPTELSPMPMTDAQIVKGPNLLAIIADLAARVQKLEGGKAITVDEAKEAMKETLTAAKEVSKK